MAQINGNNDGNNLSGTASDDQIFGFGGNDGLQAGAGNDLISGGDGNDQVGESLSFTTRETGNDTMFGDAGDDRITGGPGDDFLVGGDGGDRIFGDLGSLDSAEAGNDVVVGGAGSDSMAGGAGFDAAYFELPRRAYAFQGTGFEFPRSNSNGARTSIEQGLTATTGSGPTAETDYLLQFEELRFVDGRIVTNPDDVVAQVYRVYEAALDRAPDPIGLNFWSDLIAAGTPVNAVGNSVVQSAEFQARYGALDNTGYVQQLYQNVLGRPGETAGVNGWVSLLNASATRGDVLAGFANSPENVANTAGVFAAGVWDWDEKAAQASRLYDTAFNRLPDLNGFLANKGALDAGLGLEDLARNYAQSAEFQALYGGPNPPPGTLVNALYRNTLNREADPDGLAFWTQRIEGGVDTREEVIVAFSESLEHKILMVPTIEGGVVFA